MKTGRRTCAYHNYILHDSLKDLSSCKYSFLENGISNSEDFHWERWPVKCIYHNTYACIIVHVSIIYVQHIYNVCIIHYTIMYTRAGKDLNFH